MRYTLLLLLVIFLSCESHSFDSDKRQIVAKDVISAQLHKAHSFDVTGFSQDTLPAFSDTIIKHPIRYNLDFIYTDSAGIIQKKRGVVLFTPDGKSVLSSHIIDQE